MKIVVLDGYTLNPGDISWSEIEQLGELTVYERTPESLVLERIGDAEVVFTNKTPLTKETIESAPSIRFIGVLATGYNVVDVNAAKEKGIPVTNVPAYGTDSVAQFVFALLLEICHHIQKHSSSVLEGKWAQSPDFCYWNFPLIALSGKTMGIIGYGRIGQAVAKIATAFGMKVLAQSGGNTKHVEEENVKHVTLDELLANSDVISLHCPLFDSTKGIINKTNINKMKTGVILINTSRGPLIVEEDLVEALESGKIYAAGLDVVAVEPIKEDNPLLKAKNIFITPHIAWAPKEARERLMSIAATNLKAFIDEKPVNVVNK